MEIINVTNRELLAMLYKDGALTLEGRAASPDSLSNLLDWIRSVAGLAAEQVYVLKGKLMNEAYGLTAPAAQYPEELPIVCVRRADMELPRELNGARYAVGGRWFDEVVDNRCQAQFQATAE